MNLHKIDKTLAERHRIVTLLEAVEREDITVSEMEEIGTKLKKAGKRALLPLFRKLWREGDGDVLSRYTYLLDFFEEESWLDQLVKVTLQRKDLGEDAKTALLGALEGYGIDVTVPPFDHLLAELGGPLQHILPKMLAKGEQGIGWFLDDFLSFPLEAQLSVIRDIPTLKAPGIVSLFEVIIGIDHEEIVAEALNSLGRIRDPAAADLLLRYMEHCPVPSRRQKAVRSLRRLSFLGVTPTGVKVVPSPLVDAYVSGIDYGGSRSLVLVHRDEESFRVLHLDLHDMEGLQEAHSYGKVSGETLESLIAEIITKEGIRRIDLPHALQFLRDALYKSRQREMFLPADFYIHSHYFDPAELLPTEYSITVPDGIKELAGSQRVFTESAGLLDDEHFEGWFVTSPRVYDLAEEWGTLDKRFGLHRVKDELDLLISRFCAEIIAPEKEQVGRRLLIQADFLQKVGAKGDVVRRTLAVAGHVLHSRIPLQLHPFFRRLALESMEAARDALAEGFDMRRMYDGYWSEDDE